MKHVLADRRRRKGTISRPPVVSGAVPGTRPVQWAGDPTGNNEDEPSVCDNVAQPAGDIHDATTYPRGRMQDIYTPYVSPPHENVHRGLILNPNPNITLNLTGLDVLCLASSRPRPGGWLHH